MSQDARDREVRQLAEDLKEDGWDIHTGLRGNGTPDAIGDRSHTPDIVATKRGATRIVEFFPHRNDD